METKSQRAVNGKIRELDSCCVGVYVFVCIAACLVKKKIRGKKAAKQVVS